MIEATIESIRVNMVTQNRVVILRESDGDRRLPIWIGSYEAEAIALEMQGVSPTRPLSYDLMCTMLDELGVEVDRIMITELSDKVYYASIVLVTDDKTLEIDARPSDALALALRCEARILIEESVMESAGITIHEDGDGLVEASFEDESNEDAAAVPELDVFRDFINSLDLDDFDKG